MSLSIIISLLIGIMIGGLFKLSDRLLEWNQRLTMIGIFLLLFTMGISLGMKIKWVGFVSLGFQSIVYALITSGGSILVAYWIGQFLLKGEDE